MTLCYVPNYWYFVHLLDFSSSNVAITNAIILSVGIIYLIDDIVLCKIIININTIVCDNVLISTNNENHPKPWKMTRFKQQTLKTTPIYKWCLVFITWLIRQQVDPSIDWFVDSFPKLNNINVESLKTNAIIPYLAPNKWPIFPNNFQQIGCLHSSWTRFSYHSYHHFTHSQTTNTQLISISKWIKLTLLVSWSHHLVCFFCSVAVALSCCLFFFYFFVHWYNEWSVIKKENLLYLLWMWCR